MRKSFVLFSLVAAAAVLVFTGIEARKRRAQASSTQPTASPKVAPTGRTGTLATATFTNLRSRPATPASRSSLGSAARPRSQTNTATPVKRVTKPESPPADPAQLETTYRSTPDESARYAVLDQLSDRGDLTALQALDRLFRSETEFSMKVEMLDSLTFYEGNNTYKLQMLGAGIQPGQPKEVRQAAIDALLDLDDASAVQILMPYKNDPDEDIRDAAKDAIEFYQG